MPVADGSAPSPDNPASFISLCANCHDSLDSELDWRTERKLVFKHAPHFAKGIRCSACHKEFPHKPGKILHVSVETCFECHGTVHGNQGVLAPTACSTCHTPDIATTTADHQQSTWLMQEGPGLARHARMATERRLYCKMCHEGSFCDSCHKVQMPHPAGWMPSGHGAEAAAKKSACIMCHESVDFCNDCHHADFPKLASWQTEHKQVVVKSGARAVLQVPHATGTVLLEMPRPDGQGTGDSWGVTDVTTRGKETTSCIDVGGRLAAGRWPGRA